MSVQTAQPQASLDEVVGILLALFVPPVGLLVAMAELVIQRHNRRRQMQWVVIYLAGWVTTLAVIALFAYR